MTLVNDTWKRFRNDFNAMTDAQVEQTTREEESKLEEAENWLEAVASWEAAGRPRNEETK